MDISGTKAVLLWRDRWTWIASRYRGRSPSSLIPVRTSVSDYANFNKCSAGTVSGTGGAESVAYLVEAGISLPDAEGGEQLNFNIRIGVAKSGPRRLELEARDYSVLGRDVLNEVRLVVERRRNMLTLGW